MTVTKASSVLTDLAHNQRFAVETTTGGNVKVRPSKVQLNGLNSSERVTAVERYMRVERAEEIKKANADSYGRLRSTTGNLL